jgi:hypothetical protein
MEPGGMKLAVIFVMVLAAVVMIVLGVRLVHQGTQTTRAALAALRQTTGRRWVGPVVLVGWLVVFGILLALVPWMSLLSQLDAAVGALVHGRR